MQYQTKFLENITNLEAMGRQLVYYTLKYLEKEAKFGIKLLTKESIGHLCYKPIEIGQKYIFRKNK